MLGLGLEAIGTIGCTRRSPSAATIASSPQSASSPAPGPFSPSTTSIAPASSPTPALASRCATTIAATTPGAAPINPRRPGFGRTTPRHGPHVLWTTLAGEPETLDPARCNESVGGEVLSNLFAGLVQYAPQQQPGPIRIVPDLATHWQQDDDGLTWRFYLRPSGWSDGTPVVAQDFVEGILRVLDPATASASAAMLYGLKGAQAFAEGRGPRQDVGVRAEGDAVLLLQLRHAVPYFLQLCAHTLMRPVPRHVLATLQARGQDVRRWARPEGLISNGAYALQRWRFRRDFTMRKNPHYWDQAHVAFLEVRGSIVEDMDTAVQLYRAGEVDVVNTGLSAAYVQTLKNEQDLHRENNLMTTFYWFNTRSPKLCDVRVRQALSLAIDRTALTTKVLRGVEHPTASLVPDGTGDYVAPQLPLFDPVRARALLAEAGYGPAKPLPPLRLVYNTATSTKQVAEAIQAMWRQHLGVDCVLENQEWRVYLRALDAGDFDVARLGWQGDVADADNFLTNVLSASGGNNRSGWQDASFEALLAQAEREQVPQARLALLQRAELRALSFAPLLPLYNGANAALIKPYVRGYGYNVLNVHPYKNMFMTAQAHDAALAPSL